MEPLGLIVVFAVLVFGTLVAAMTRYKRCPADQILVIFGKVKEGRAAKCIHGGASFVWPLIQDYRFLELAPMTIEIGLRNALSKQNIRVNVPSRFTIGISTEPSIMSAAAERLLSMKSQEIEEYAKDIIFGQLRATIATMDIEEINADRENFEKKVMDNIESELRKIGLKLINVNITDITDESAYIEALGKKAAAEAINQAKIEVARQERDGDTGQANANKERRINVATADAEAVKGENLAIVIKANSDADRDVAKAEAKKRSDAASMVQDAKAKEEGYDAEKQAELKRAEREMATKEADQIVPAEIARREVVIAAEADKEKAVLEGRAKGEATQAEMEGQAEGMKAILEKQADGFRRLVDAALGEPTKAIQFLIANNLEDLMAIQVEAIKNIKIDKVTVWDTGCSSDGTPTTANFLSGMAKSIPQLNDLFKMSGMELPNWMGKVMEDAHAKADEVKEEVVPESEKEDSDDKE